MVCQWHWAPSLCLTRQENTQSKIQPMLPMSTDICGRKRLVVNTTSPSPQNGRAQLSFMAVPHDRMTIALLLLLHLHTSHLISLCAMPEQYEPRSALRPVSQRRRWAEVMMDGSKSGHTLLESCVIQLLTSLRFVVGIGSIYVRHSYFNSGLIWYH